MLSNEACSILFFIFSSGFDAQEWWEEVLAFRFLDYGTAHTYSHAVITTRKHFVALDKVTASLTMGLSYDL